MAKTIKFPLEMKDGVKVRTIEELRNNIDYDKLSVYFLNGKLHKWLTDRSYDEYANRINEINIESSNAMKELCDILGVQYADNLSRHNDLKKQKEIVDKLAYIYKMIGNEVEIENINLVATNQMEFEELLQAGLKKIYLAGEEFELPVDINNVKIVGINEPLVKINSEEVIDFEALEVGFDNVKFDDAYQEMLDVHAENDDCYMFFYHKSYIHFNEKDSMLPGVYIIYDDRIEYYNVFDYIFQKLPEARFYKSYEDFLKESVIHISFIKVKELKKGSNNNEISLYEELGDTSVYEFSLSKRTVVYKRRMVKGPSDSYFEKIVDGEDKLYFIFTGQVGQYKDTIIEYDKNSDNIINHEYSRYNGIGLMDLKYHPQSSKFFSYESDNTRGISEVDINSGKTYSINIPHGVYKTLFDDKYMYICYNFQDSGNKCLRYNITTKQREELKIFNELPIYGWKDRAVSWYSNYGEYYNTKVTIHDDKMFVLNLTLDHSRQCYQQIAEIDLSNNSYKMIINEKTDMYEDKVKIYQNVAGLEIKGKWLFLLGCVTGKNAYGNSTYPMVRIHLETYVFERIDYTNLCKYDVAGWKETVIGEIEDDYLEL